MTLIEETFETPTCEEISALIRKIGGSRNKLCETLLADPLSVDKKQILRMYQGLRHIIRFRGLRSMYYDNVSLHQTRLTYMLSRCSKLIDFVLGDDFDFTFARELFLHHDDPEAFSIFGDVPSHFKSNLTTREKQVLEYVERKGIESLSKVFVLSSGVDFKDVLIEADEKIRPEGVVLTYMDKAGDGFMQTFHEVTAGNEQYEEPFLNYMKTFRKFKEGAEKGGKFEHLSRFFEEGRNPKGYRKHILSDFRDYPEERDWFFHVYCLFNIDNFLRQESRLDELLTTGKPHTPKDVIKSDFGFKPYFIRKQCYLQCRVSMPFEHRTTSPMLLLTNQIN